MRITVLGLGHLGMAAAAGLAITGHQVNGVDVDRQRVQMLKSQRLFMYEPGLSAWIKWGLQKGNLRFIHQDEMKGMIGDIVLIATGTPPMNNGAPDLRQVWSALGWIKRFDLRGVVVIMKSTVPPGTGRIIMERVLRGTGASYVSNPEFLREGQALEDWQSPYRIVIGAETPDGRSVKVVKEMHTGIDAPFLVTNVTSAEMIKYASNAFLATRISFMNEIAALCDEVGGSIDAVTRGIFMDARTGSMVKAGVGYGGSCFPKDIRALNHLAVSSGVELKLLKSVAQVNDRQRRLPVEALAARFGGDLSGVTIGVLGLAFKPNTDDVRGAASLTAIDELIRRGARVQAFDPRATEAARAVLPPSVLFMDSVEQACLGAHAVALLTEWDEFSRADWGSISRNMLPPKFIFDGRNVLDPDELAKMGFKYKGVGRGEARSPERKITAVHPAF